MFKNIKNDKKNLKRQKKFELNKKVVFKKNCFIDENTFLEGGNVISPETRLYNSKVGYGTYFGRGCIITSMKFGRYCSIGSRLRVIVGKHPTKDFVSTHPAFFSTLKQSGFTYSEEQLFKEISYVDEEKKIFVDIGSDVWIGSDVRIVDGITVHDGAIIAAGSVVTKDVLPYTIVGGVPAKIIRKRFDNNDIEFLTNLQWWNKDETWIRANAKYFSNIELLKEKVQIFADRSY